MAQTQWLCTEFGCSSGSTKTVQESTGTKNESMLVLLDVV